MKSTAKNSRRGLLYVLFTMFEMLLWSSVVLVRLVDPRGVSGVDNTVGVIFLFSLVGLLIVSWLLKRVTPRMATIGFFSVLTGFIAFMFLPSVP